MDNKDTSTRPDVSIIIINWNTHDLLEQCLASIVRNTNNISYEVKVVDNNSTEQGFEKVEQKFSKYPNFFFIKNNQNIGGLADNQVLPSCHGRYILLMGPDTIVLPCALDSMVAFLDHVVVAGAVTAKLLNPDGSTQRYCMRFWDLSVVFFLLTSAGALIDKWFFKNRFYRYYTLQDVSFDRIVAVEVSNGACFMLRNDPPIVDYLVDKDFPFYFGDIDLCKRIHNRGYKIFLLPLARVVHFTSSAFRKAESSWKAQEFRHSLLKYFKKYQRNKIPLLKLLLLVDDTIKHMILPILRR